MVIYRLRGVLPSCFLSDISVFFFVFIRISDYSFDVLFGHEFRSLDEVYCHVNYKVISVTIGEYIIWEILTLYYANLSNNLVYMINIRKWRVWSLELFIINLDFPCNVSRLGHLKIVWPIVKNKSRWCDFINFYERRYTYKIEGVQWLGKIIFIFLANAFIFYFKSWIATAICKLKFCLKPSSKLCCILYSFLLDNNYRIGSR